MSSEQDYLGKYQASDFPIVLLTVDSVLLTYHNDKLKVLLVKRANHPDQGKWGLPGGFVDQEKDKHLDAAAKRTLAEKTGIDPPYIEQLCSQGGASRDPRGWSATVAYSALIPYAECSVHVDSVSDTQWFDREEVFRMDLAFDHRTLIEKGLERFRQKALYSLVTVKALQEPFTMHELKRVHELLIGKSIQRKSFQRRVEASGLLVETGQTKALAQGRPAMLYQASGEVEEYRFVRNFDG